MRAAKQTFEHGEGAGIAFVRALTLLAALVVIALPMTACSSTSSPAARFGSYTIAEDEVSDYTQSYREKNGLTDDKAWVDYLATSGKTAETWRQEAIRQLADKILIEQKAQQLGIKADAQTVQDKIAQAKEDAGVAADDQGAWASYLAERGQTPQSLQEEYEFNSVEQQVFEAEIEFSDKMKAQMCDDYISTNLADQVVCHYAAIAVPLKDKAKAEGYEKQLEGLSDEELTEKFSKLVAKQADESAKAGLTCGDIGWDFTYDEQTIDPDLKLRKATLREGQLYHGVLKGTDAYRVVMCTQWASFAQTPTYESLKSDSLKQHVEKLAMVSNWTARCMQYLSDLEDEAHIEISAMPQGLAYDVVDDAAS